MPNYQRSNKIENHKMSKDIQNILDSVSHNEALDLIEYFEEQKCEQQKRDNLNLIISIVAAVSGVLSLIITFFQLFKS